MTNNIPQPVGEEKIVYQGKIIEVVQQLMRVGDEQINFERARRSPGTRLIIISEDKKLLLTKEYRTELKDWDFRLPGGKVCDSLEEYNQLLKSGESLLVKAKQAAKKEAEEETSIRVQELEHYYTSKCGATVEWDLFYFVVRVDKPEMGEQKLEQGENIEIGWYSFEEAEKIALRGEMKEDRSAAVLLRYLYG